MIMSMMFIHIARDRINAYLIQVFTSTIHILQNTSTQSLRDNKSKVYPGDFPAKMSKLGTSFTKFHYNFNSLVRSVRSSIECRILTTSKTLIGRQPNRSLILGSAPEGCGRTYLRQSIGVPFLHFSQDFREGLPQPGGSELEGVCRRYANEQFVLLGDIVEDLGLRLAMDKYNLKCFLKTNFFQDYEISRLIFMVLTD